MDWSWICRDCKSKYPESGEGLHEGINPSGLLLKLCACGGVVDLCPTKRPPDAAIAATIRKNGKFNLVLASLLARNATQVTQTVSFLLAKGCK
jgi:hypothetical protein